MQGGRPISSSGPKFRASSAANARPRANPIELLRRCFKPSSPKGAVIAAALTDMTDAQFVFAFFNHDI